MDNGDIGERVESCIHRMGVTMGYIVNNGQVPPVVFFNASGPCVVTLTNQVLFVRCPACFDKIRTENWPTNSPGPARLLKLLRP